MSPNINIILTRQTIDILTREGGKINTFAVIIKEEMCKEYISGIKGKNKVLSDIFQH